MRYAWYTPSITTYDPCVKSMESGANTLLRETGIVMSASLRADWSSRMRCSTVFTSQVDRLKMV